MKTNRKRYILHTNYQTFYTLYPKLPKLTYCMLGVPKLTYCMLECAKCIFLPLKIITLFYVHHFDC